MLYRIALGVYWSSLVELIVKVDPEPRCRNQFVSVLSEVLEHEPAKKKTETRIKNLHPDLCSLLSRISRTFPDCGWLIGLAAEGDWKDKQHTRKK